MSTSTGPVKEEGWLPRMWKKYGKQAKHALIVAVLFIAFSLPWTYRTVNNLSGDRLGGMRSTTQIVVHAVLFAIVACVVFCLMKKEGY